MAFCKLCDQWYNCYCIRCRYYEPYDNTFPRKDGIKDPVVETCKHGMLVGSTVCIKCCNNE